MGSSKSGGGALLWACIGILSGNRDRIGLAVGLDVGLAVGLSVGDRPGDIE